LEMQIAAMKMDMHMASTPAGEAAPQVGTGTAPPPGSPAARMLSVAAGLAVSPSTRGPSATATASAVPQRVSQDDRVQAAAISPDVPAKPSSGSIPIPNMDVQCEVWENQRFYIYKWKDSLLPGERCVHAAAVLLCCCAAVLLCCCVAVLLCCCVAVLLCCCVAVLLCCCAAVLLCCCVAVLLCCCVAVLLCCCAAVLLCCCVVVLLCCCVAVLLCCCAAVLLCCCAAVLLCCCVAVLLCCCAAVLLCCCVAVCRCLPCCCPAYGAAAVWCPHHPPLTVRHL